MWIFKQIVIDKFIFGHFLEILDDDTAYLLRMTCRQFRAIIRRPFYKFHGMYSLKKIAIADDNLSLLKFVHKYYDICPRDLLRSIHYNSTECMKFILSIGHYEGIGLLAYEAAKNGRVDYLECLKENGVSPDNVYVGALRGDQLECLKYLMQYNECNSFSTSIAAAYSFRCLQYLHECKIPIYHSSCTEAARSGLLDCLEFAYKHGAPIKANTLIAATNFECLKYAYEIYGSMPTGVCDNMAYNSCFEGLKYAHENGGFWNKQTAKYAAANCTIECLKYVYENGCAMSKKLCEIAAQAGSLPCLKYAHEICGIDFGIAIDMAANNGAIECIQYIHERSPGPVNLCDMAATSGNISCIKFVRSLGYEWTTNACVNAVSVKSLKMLKYLHENGCPWDENTCIVAVNHNSLKCIKYAIYNGCPVNSMIFKNNRQKIRPFLLTIIHRFKHDDIIDKFLNWQ